MTDKQIAEAFLYAYKKAGGMHWIYNGLSDCVRVWRERGIIGMPSPTPGALRLLQSEISADDAFLEGLRTKRKEIA